MQNTLQQISIYGRLLGAVFYYEPNDARLTDILTFFRNQIGCKNGKFHLM